MPGLLQDVRSTLDRAVTVVAPPRAAVLDRFRQRLDEPLRVAIAGMVKAGKSTLLNALVGEQLAATDAGECTRVVTWYRGGHRYQVLAKPRGAEPVELAFRNDDGRLQIDLGGLSPDDIERLDVTWPSNRLAQLTLIDTPGMSSLSTDVSQRSVEFLTPESSLNETDAVIYLMRRFHENDVRFLESFTDDEPEKRTPVNGLAVLSRADEIGGCQPDSMQVAAKVADQWRRNPRLRQLCQTVVPVAGLLAQAGSTLREHEFRSLARLAELPAEDLDAMQLSADRFVSRPVPVELSDEVRRELLNRIGLYGARLALAEIRAGRITTSSQLAAALVDASGLEELRRLLVEQFEFRADVLRARSALIALDHVLSEEATPEARRLLVETQRITLGAHEIVEIGVLTRLRSGELRFPERHAQEAERLLGADGAASHTRLGLPADAPLDARLAAADAAAARYRQLSSHPLMSRDVVEASEAVVRSCEGVIAALESSSPA